MDDTPATANQDPVDAFEQDAMESLGASLESSFSVTNHPNDPNSVHPRFSMYKNKSLRDKEYGQEKRRQSILRNQKKRRDDYLNFARALADGDVNDDDGDKQWEEEETMDTSGEFAPKPLRISYRNQLMLSEWLIKVPNDFSQSWIMRFAPEGRRCLVVAGQGKTKQYLRNGTFQRRFPALLPGGSPTLPRGKTTILDCIFSGVQKTYYVLDVMVWNDQSFYECDTDLRFFWIKTKLAELEELGEISRYNKYRFKDLPYFPCERIDLEQALKGTLPFSTPLDGILFYHCKVHYHPGPNPLVGWLKACMTKELLDIDPSSEILGHVPPNYQDYKTFIDDFEKDRQEKRNQRRNDKRSLNDSKKREMELSETPEPTEVMDDALSK